jgi:Fibronectin type III domain
MRGDGRGMMKGLMKQAGASITVLCLLTMGVMIAGCGGGGGEGVSSQVVSGVAATGAPLAGEVKIKDSLTPAQEKTTVIGSDGSFAFDVTDMKGPFILRATGQADGEAHTLHSFADNTGIANINPLTNVAVASAAGVDDPAKVFENPDRDKLNKIKSNLPASVAEILDKLKPLLKIFNADNIDPFRGDYKADHTHLDGLFDNVKITLVDGTLTITSKKAGAVIFTSMISDIKNGELTANADILPNPGAIPDKPNNVTAIGGDAQVTISWTAVGNATSYNIYWSTTALVAATSATKIAGATSPYVQTGLTAGTRYYYIVTAVNSAGEGAASDEASATTTSAPAPTPTVPAAPTGVLAAGGTKQVTISWPALSGATSYNLYWSTTAGVTKTTGTKIAGATSPTVQNGLTDSTTYYYVVTAVNSAGESDPSVQVAAATLAPTTSPTVPSAPTGATATGGANQVTVSWSAVSGATSYNLYWLTTSGVTTSTGTKITGTTSPYVHTGLPAGTAYYYIVTAVNGIGESLASTQATATTNAPAPSAPAAPTGVSATGGAKQVSVSWSTVSGATSYNLYWATTSGVTTATGTKIAGATSPYVQTGLADSTAYFYIVTSQNGAGEGAASAQATAATNAAPPPPPPALNGAALYTTNCQRCHGALASTTIAGRTLTAIKNAGMTRGLADDVLLAILSVLP